MLSDSFEVILLDIEGTTTPVDFVYGVLFPFSKRELPSFISEYWNTDVLAREREGLWCEYYEESLTPPPWSSREDATGATRYLLWLSDQDRKSTALKSIQGKIWEDGYKSGLLKGEIYPDVLPALKRWTEGGKKVCIFSSGSVLAQKLLFASSISGDLSGYLSGYFDTETGPKRDAKSYSSIAEKIGVPPKKVLFVSDILEELLAAKESGMGVVLAVRPGNKPVSAGDIPSVLEFTEL